MKRRIASLFLVLCLIVELIPLATASEVLASGTCGSLFWSLTQDGTLCISGKGRIPDYRDIHNWDGSTIPVDAPWYQYSDQISTLIIDEGVTGIGAEAFMNCPSITSVVLPDSLVRIDDYAFSNCFESGELILSKNITYIGNGAFRECGLTSVTFSDGFSPYFGQHVFSGSNNLHSVFWGEGIAKIPYETFAYCTNLVNIVVPESVTEIDAYAFSYCSSLHEVGLPNRITKIGDGAFMDCTSLKEITLPNELLELTDYTFGYCTNLEEITIPANVSYISNDAFTKCTSLRNIRVHEDNMIYCSSSGALYDKDKTTLIKIPEGIVGFFAIDDGVTTIGTYSIKNFSNLSSIGIPDSITTIEYAAFERYDTYDENKLAKFNVYYAGTPEEWERVKTDSYYSYNQGLWYATIHFSTTDPVSHPYLAQKTAATCTEDGYTVWACECGHSFTDDYIQATGHNYESIVTAPTCTEEGYSTHICINCNDSYIDSYTDAIGHSYTAIVATPTCTEQGYTTYTCHCGDSHVTEYVDALGHDMGEWETVTSPTCTEDGSEYRSCSRCDYGETRPIEPIGHSHTAVVTPPTCTEQGYTTYTCLCGNSYIAEYVDALGHDMGEWEIVTSPTCTEDGAEYRSCSRCDYGETRPIEPIGHSHTAVVTPPTCTEQGYTTHCCTVCGNQYVDSYIDALGHTWQDHHCIRCGQVDPSSFWDVPASEWYYSPVLWALGNGITTGASETTFNPDGACLRAQVVTFLHRAAESPAPTSGNNPFTDVKSSDFFYAPVLWAVEKGITNGVSATKFGSYDVCNRAAVVTFLWRAAGSPEPESTENPFSDVKPSDYFYKPVLWAVEKGITNGLSANEFGPAADCNRAQVVTFLYRAYN